MVRLRVSDMFEHDHDVAASAPVSPAAHDGALTTRMLPVDGMLLLEPAVRAGRGKDGRAACHALVHAGIAVTEHFMRRSQVSRYGRNVVCGLHCQLPPCAQGRLIHCNRGAIWAVGGDVRTGSRSFGQWVGETLSAENGHQLWIPPGFLHGLCTLHEDTEVICRHTRPSVPSCARTIRWNDGILGVDWPVMDRQAVLSPSDGQAPSFSNVIDWFFCS